MKIALVVAHVDDVEIWAGGTILNCKHTSEVQVYYLYCTDDVRKKEAYEAALNLHAEVMFIDNFKDLKDSIVNFHPNILITHWEHDCHPEHRKTYETISYLLPELVVEHGIHPNVYCMETYNLMGSNSSHVFIPTDYIDISDVWEQKIALIDIFKSQPTDYWKSMVENQNRLNGSRVGVQYAESFIQIPVLGVVKRSSKLLRGN